VEKALAQQAEAMEPQWQVVEKVPLHRVQCKRRARCARPNRGVARVPGTATRQQVRYAMGIADEGTAKARAAVLVWNGLAQGRRRHR
jgi:hypothetical protein